MNIKPKKRKEMNLNRIELAILNLAEIIESNPYCDYRARKETLDILGITLLPPKSKAKKV